MYLTHPLGVTLGKIIVYRDDMNAFTRQRVEIRGERGHKRFTFTRFKLGNAPLVNADAAHKLNFIMPHIEYAVAGFSDYGKAVVQNIVERFPFSEPFF